MRLFLTALLLSGAALAAPRSEEILKASDHKKIGKEVAAYWTAKQERKDIGETFSKLASTVEKVDDKLKKKGGDVLTAVEDWRSIFWVATANALEDKKAKKGKVTTESGGVPFTYWVDKKYRPANGPLPLVLVVPNEGEKAEDAVTELSATALGTQSILVGVHMREFAGSWDSADAGIHVLKTLGTAVGKNMFGFDYDRIVLLGRGKGFAAASSFAQQFTYLFAGLAGHGDIPMADPTNFSNLPTYVTGGGKGADFAKQVETLGYGNCTNGGDAVDALASWITEARRSAYPMEVTFAPASAQARSSYWLTAEGVDMDASPKVTATADPAANKITIAATGVGKLRVFFNDRLADLGKPVTVEINGKTHETTVTRKLRWMIDKAFTDGDWGRVFTAEASFEVTETP